MPDVIYYSGTIGVSGEQKSRSKFLQWPGFERWTSHLADQRATARLLRTLVLAQFLQGKETCLFSTSEPLQCSSLSLSLCLYLSVSVCNYLSIRKVKRSSIEDKKRSSHKRRSKVERIEEKRREERRIDSIENCRRPNWRRKLQRRCQTDVAY